MLRSARLKPIHLILATSLVAIVLVCVVPRSGAQGIDSLSNQLSQQNSEIEGAQGRLSAVRKRVAVLQQNVDIQVGLLDDARQKLRDAHVRLSALQLREAHGRDVLARQLVANYQTPPPDVVSVVMNAKGFSDLLERAEAVREIERANAATIERVRNDQLQVHDQVVTLRSLESRRERQAVTILAQRDQIASLELSLAKRQKLRIDRRAGLKKKLKAAQTALLRAQARTASQAGLVPSDFDVSAPANIPGFTAHGGDFGFFQAPGTNYSFGDEPQIVSRLDALGKALKLHLTGISGYRTPQHSMEVGGFANDPHTRGEASDTLGVEAVPQFALSKFGLWRPFSAFTERNHIQLLGSSKAL